jgi:hypothetical protein
LLIVKVPVRVVKPVLAVYEGLKPPVRNTGIERLRFGFPTNVNWRAWIVPPVETGRAAQAAERVSK